MAAPILYASPRQKSNAGAETKAGDRVAGEKPAGSAAGVEPPVASALLFDHVGALCYTARRRIRSHGKEGHVRQEAEDLDMILLEPAAFASLAGLPLWAGLEIHLAVASVLAGTTPGNVYVDDAGAPGSALLHTGGRFYLAGSPGDEAWRRALRAFFLDRARPPEAHMEGWGAFAIYTGTGWQPAVREVVAGCDHTPLARLYLELDTTRAGQHPPLPPGFRLRPVDRELLAEQDLGRLAELREEMVSECPSVAFFLEHRFGVCLESEGRLAGWCLSEYDAGARSEVGIETAPEHRRRGLGTTLALALAAEARARGIARLGWHCYQGNEASVATALRAGFRQVVAYGSTGVRFGQHDSRTET